MLRTEVKESRDYGAKGVKEVRLLSCFTPEGNAKPRTVFRDFITLCEGTVSRSVTECSKESAP